MNLDFKIRSLTKDDIEQMAKARIEQENENGNGASAEYIKKYKKILKKMFEEEKLIAKGAFKEDSLVSLACLNLISFGNEKKIPYLCAVWTNPEYRGMGLASKVNNELTKSIINLKDKLQPRVLLTLEGNEVALGFYKKNGYEILKGETTFLGDASSINLKDIEYEEFNQNNEIKYVKYMLKGKPIISILYSEEQLFPHPTNPDGKMNRIISIKDLQKDASEKTINVFLQHFFSKHRFCKFNVEELSANEPRLYEIFGVKSGNIEGLIEGFERLSFRGLKNKDLKIKRGFSIMEKNLTLNFDKCNKNKGGMRDEN